MSKECQVLQPISRFNIDKNNLNIVTEWLRAKLLRPANFCVSFSYARDLTKMKVTNADYSTDFKHDI